MISNRLEKLRFGQRPITLLTLRAASQNLAEGVNLRVVDFRGAVMFCRLPHRKTARHELPRIALKSQDYGTMKILTSSMPTTSLGELRTVVNRMPKSVTSV